MLEVVPLQARLAVHGLAGAGESETRAAKDYAVMGMPAAEHGGVNLTRDAADCGALPHPTRGWVAYPRLAVRLLMVLYADAADGVRQVVVACRGDGRRQAAQAQLLQPGQEAFLLLAAEDQSCCVARPAT